MNKPSAKLAIVALAIPVFGGFATYAAAQVSDKPAPQVVIPGTPAHDDKGGVKATTASSTSVGHNVNDANEANDDKVAKANRSDDPAGHDGTDDKGGSTAVSDDPAGHDATDDHGADAVAVTTPTSVDDHGVDAVDPTTPTSIDDHGGKTVSPTTATTPTSVDDHGSHSGGRGIDG